MIKELVRVTLTRPNPLWKTGLNPQLVPWILFIILSRNTGNVELFSEISLAEKYHVVVQISVIEQRVCNVI